MVESMVEGVARAIYEVPGRGYEWSNAEEPERKHALKYARAAIEAMREPTDAMMDVMNDVVIDGPDYVDFYPSMADCASLWTAGIDAALNEQVSG